MFFIALNVFFLYVYGLTLAWNLGNHFNLKQFLIPALALLIACIGVVLLNSKPNWFIGIRTPWTLSSETNWEKTHKLGAVLFELSALIMLLGVVFHEHLDNPEHQSSSRCRCSFHLLSLSLKYGNFLGMRG